MAAPDENLRPYATDRQWEMYCAIHEHGGVSQAARALGVRRSVVQRMRDRILKAAAERGYAPEHDYTHPVPPGFTAKGVSTLYNGKGEVSAQWVKSTADNEARARMLREAFEAWAEEIPRRDPTPAPALVDTQLCNLFTLTDAHIGMLAWGRESGADWDLQIAEKTLVEAFAQMVERSPRAETAIVCQLGDWLHFDGQIAQTPTSGHPLDADGRFEKLVQTAVRVLRAIIDTALTRAKRVRLEFVDANHDPASAVHSRVWAAALYEREPRVAVNQSPMTFTAYRHGEVALGFHHGHTVKPAELPLVFYHDFSEIFGTAKHRYIHTGHRHAHEERDRGGVTLIQHPTLAARDAYAARHGWRSRRACRAITYHKDHGEVASLYVTPEMLNA